MIPIAAAEIENVRVGQVDDLEWINDGAVMATDIRDAAITSEIENADWVSQSDRPNPYANDERPF